MDKIRLGRTGLEVTACSFGALPVQRCSTEEGARLLRAAYEYGINFFDTANAYSDSEEKIGLALSDVRDKVIIATKSGASTKQGMLEHLDLSLRRMKTDYIDIYQLHNPAVLPDPNDPDGLYAGLLEAKKSGKIRFIGMTNHRLELARTAALSGLYDTVQYPFSLLASAEEIELAQLCAQQDVGFIAMKGLAGGLITNIPAAVSFIKQYPNVVPIWGIQRQSELEQFIELEKQPPVFDAAMRASVEEHRAALSGSFCHGCGYCLPCPAGIEIPTAARMSLLLRRSPSAQWLTGQWAQNMERIADCIHCGACMSRCPYGLNTPELLAENLADYRTFRADSLAQ